MWYRIRLLMMTLFVLGTTALPRAAHAEGVVFVVTSAADDPDADLTDNVCRTGAASCTLRAALEQANALSGLDTIRFSIPDVDVATIRPATTLPTITSPVVIDGYSQPGARPNGLAHGFDGVLKVELKLELLPNGGNGLVIQAGGSAIKGLVINRSNGGNEIAMVTRGGNVIEGNIIGTDAATSGPLAAAAIAVFINQSPDNVVGGSAPASRNVLAGNGGGVVIQGTTAVRNRVEGNLIGVGIGGHAVPNTTGVLVQQGAGNNTIGGSSGVGPNSPCTGLCNTISANREYGVDVLFAGSANQIQGNLVGVDPAGSTLMGNGIGGVSLRFTPGTLVGGDNPAQGNVVAGNVWGIQVLAGSDQHVRSNWIRANSTGLILSNGAAERNIVTQNTSFGIHALGNTNLRANWVGTDPQGTGTLGNASDGIRISGDNNTVGGTGAGDGNIIAFNTGAGVFVESSRTANAIRSNSIHSNNQLGIDLAPRGVTANDSGDGDSGANALQNFPVLSSVTVPASIAGALGSTPGAAFAVDFFSSSTCDSAGFGEASTFLGSASVTTDSAGNASFSYTAPSALTFGWSVTATATDAAGNTSEFSRCERVSGDGSPPAIEAMLSPEPNATGWHNADVTLSWTVTDPESGIVSSSGCTTRQITDQTTGTTFTCSATNGAGLSATKSVMVRLDKTPPTCSALPTPDRLWPPDHQLVEITVLVNVSDVLSGAAGYTLVSVVSNQPDNGLGDGDQPQDIQAWTLGQPDTAGQLRAERAVGVTRVYTIRYEARDIAGNRGVCEGTVTVPVDMRP